MILNFKKVILHNFASYSHAEIQLNSRGFCLVSGRNYFTKDNAHSNGAGKCFGAGTKILMYNGTIKNVEDIVAGDLVMGPDSSPRLVIETHTGEAELYKVASTKTDNYSYICNGAHELNLFQTCAYEKFKNIPNEIQISVDDYLANKIYPNTFKRYYNQMTTTGVIFNSNNEQLPLDPYLLGLWLGDGSSHDATICSNDIEIKNYLYKYANENSLNILEQTKTDSTCINYRFCKTNFGKNSGRGNSVFNKLKSLSLLKNKHIPDIYLTSSIDERLKLLAGLLDTDGCLIKHRGKNNSESYYFEITQKNKKLAEQILLLTRLLGFRATISTKEAGAYVNKAKISSGIYYRIVITGDLSKIPTLIKRKQAPYHSTQHVHTLVPHIEHYGYGKYYGFMCNGDHKFLLADGTIVHNSMIWSAICYTLTGETIGGIRSGLKNLFIDEDSAYTRIEFSVDKDNYEITRVIAPKSDLHIIKNGVDVSGKGITESKKKLEELLPDLNKDLIASTFIIGQGMPNAFSKFSPSGRKEVLERLTKSDFMIDEVKKRIAARMDVLNAKIRAHEDLLLINNTKLTDLNNIIAADKAQLKSMIKPDFAAEAKKLNDLNNNLELQLTALTNLITTKTQEQTNIDNELMAVNSQMAKDIADVNEEYNNAVAGGYKKKATLAVEYNTIESEIRNISAEISKIKNIKEFCPTCGQKLIGVEKPSTVDLEAKLQQKQAEAKVKQSELVNVNSQLSAMDAKKTQILNDIKAQFSTQLTPLTARKQVLPNELSTLRTNQNIISTNIATNKAQLARLDAESKSWDDKYNTLQNNIIENEKMIAGITAVINEELVKKLDTEEHIAVVKKIDTLAKRDLRGHLLANIITYIDRRAKDFSEIVFGTKELNVSLAGNALEISYYGKMFDNLSGGEKMRVDLILQLAIRDMLKAYLNTHANILVLDEITDFLDKQSCKAVMSLIEKELNTVESVFIISHHTEELGLPIDTELKIVKNADGISMLE